MKTQPLKGMRDLLPREQALRDYIQGQILATYRAAGFQRISTPILEDMENLDKSDGGDNLNLIFKVLKRGDKLEHALASGDEKQLSDMGLRYDLTLPLSRYYAANRNELPSPFKVIQTDRVYRAERPQKGRLREFVQCDIDILGDSSPNAEVELIDVTTHIILEISDGPEIPTAGMPDVVKMDVETAIKMLTAKGFQKIETYSVDSSLPQNQVAVQSEDPDSVVALSKEILLGISNGNSAAPGVPDTPQGTVPPTASGSELVEFSVPIRPENYNLVICPKGQANQQVAAGVIQPGDNVFSVPLAGSGVQEYDLYINGEYYQSMKVTFNNG